MSALKSKGPRRYYWYLQLLKFFAPSSKTVQLVLLSFTVLSICWLFLHYGKSELIEKVLIASLGCIAGGGGVISYQKLTARDG